MRRKPETTLEKIPGEYVETIDPLWLPIFREYMHRWANSYTLEWNSPDLVDLLRAIYIQGVFDGHQAAEMTADSA